MFKFDENKKILFAFLLLHFAVWSAVPMLRGVVPMDSAEAIVWGSEWTLGTNKHPPLSGWLAEIFFQVFRTPAAVYILSQACVLTAFVFIWKLARRFFDEDKALLATLFTEGVVYFNFTSVEYNVNVLSLALVPAVIYFFHQKRWICLGVAAGLAMLAKYTNAFVFAGLLAWLAATREGRAQWRKPGPYIAGIVGAAIFLPHLAWLWRHDFFVFDYMEMRARKAASFGVFDHIVFPLQFLAAQALAMAGAILLFVLTRFKATVGEREAPRRPEAFLFCAGILPILLFAAYGVIRGISMKSMWGSALAPMTTIVLFYCFGFKLPARAKKLAVRRAWILFAVFAAAGLAMAAGSESPRFRLPAGALAQDIQEIWAERSSESLVYVGGDVWLGSVASVYSQERPRVVFNMDARQVPWIDWSDFGRAGGVVLAKDSLQYKNFKLGVEPIVLEYGKQKVYVGIIP